jgi:hypothetical protein
MLACYAASVVFVVRVEMSNVKRRIIRAGGWGLAKRLIKPIPIVGSIFAVGLAGYEIRRKGLLKGAVHVGLDATPVVGTAKNVLEIFTGDLIPDKADRRTTSTVTPVKAVELRSSDDR